MLTEVLFTPLLALLALDPGCEPPELAGEGRGDMGEGVPVLLGTQGEGACAAREELLKCSLSVREYFIAASFL